MQKGKCLKRDITVWSDWQTCKDALIMGMKTPLILGIHKCDYCYFFKFQKKYTVLDIAMKTRDI